MEFFRGYWSQALRILAISSSLNGASAVSSLRGLHALRRVFVEPLRRHAEREEGPEPLELLMG
jgi:hypothetical protein